MVDFRPILWKIMWIDFLFNSGFCWWSWFRILGKREQLQRQVSNVFTSSKCSPSGILAIYEWGPYDRLCIKVGWGQGDWDIRTRVWGLGTWGPEMRDLGTSLIKYGTQGRQIQGRKGRGMRIIIAKVGGKSDISHFPREYVLVKATHPALLRVPPCLFTKRRLSKDPLHWRKWNCCPRPLADGILEPKAG